MKIAIKFTDEKEFRLIESKLIELGYESDQEHNYSQLNEMSEFPIQHYVVLDCISFGIYVHCGVGTKKVFENLNEFLTTL